jgi:hypothetical protein
MDTITGGEADGSRGHQGYDMLNGGLGTTAWGGAAGSCVFGTDDTITPLDGMWR